jgi:hypothetical protein
MSNSNWLDRYKPAKLSEVLGDKSQIIAIDRFIKKFTNKKFSPEKIPCPNLIITGMNGIGKTLITNLVIQENQLEKVTADLSNISVARKTKRKKKVEKETTGMNRTIMTYYTSLKNYKKTLPSGEYVNTKIALVVDDVSNISNPKEKEALKAIIKINNKYKLFPIIIIANMKHSKIVNELKKMVTYIIKTTSHDGKKESRKLTNEIILQKPNYMDLENFIKKIAAQEKLNIIKRKGDDSDIYVKIVKHSQYDIRRLINILEELKLIYNDKEVTLDKFKKYCETSKKKDMDPGIYDATKTLLNRYTNMQNALLLYGEERATIPLMVHENYPLNIRNQYPKMSVDDQINLMFDISKSMSESDKVDGLIYSNQCWSLQPVHGFYSCVIPSYHINKIPGKFSNDERYRYTQDYNKTSIKKINNKVIKKAQEHHFLKKVSIYDFLYMASILKSLLDAKDYITIAELMKPYKLQLKEIESIIKIDKIKNEKSKKTNYNLTGKQKNILKDLLGVDQ